MRIGFFTDFYLPSIVGGGVAVSIDIFRRELEKAGHQIYIFCPQEPTRKWSELNSLDNQKVIRFWSIPAIWFRGYRDTFPFTCHKIKTITNLKLDIVHLHTPAQIGLLGMLIAKKEHLPLVATYHTDLVEYAAIYKRTILGLFVLSLIFPIVSFDIRTFKDFLWTLKPAWPIAKWNQRNVKRMIKVFLNHCDLVLSPSQKIKNKLQTYAVSTPIKILPTGADTEEIQTVNKINFRKLYHLNKTQPLLLFVGRLAKEKNIELILRAMPLVLKEVPNAKLVIIGEGPNRQNLAKIIAKLKIQTKVILTGYVSNAIKIAAYQACDIFIFPSLTETQGLVINEAALQAKPIIFADHQISPVLSNRLSGLKINNSELDLAQKVLYLLNHRKFAQQLGLTAQKLVYNLTAKSQADKLIKIYSNLIANQK